MESAPDQLIAVIDDDPALCDLLSTLLSGPGRVVETVVGAAGLTAELLSLSRPRLVLMNPRIAGVSLEELRELVLVVRELTQARFILMVGEDDQHAELPRRLGADQEIPISVLLRDPLKELALSTEAAEAEPVLRPDETRSFDTLSADDILSMDLAEDPVAAQVPPRASPSQRLQRPPGLKIRDSSAASNLATLIDEELGAPPAASREHQFDLTLDTVSEHNLVVDAWKQVEGVFVSTLFPPQLGDRLHLRLTFPWGAVAEVDGVASWATNETFRRKRSGVGVTVVLTPAFKVLAQRFLALRQPTLRPG